MIVYWVTLTSGVTVLQFSVFGLIRMGGTFGLFILFSDIFIFLIIKKISLSSSCLFLAFWLYNICPFWQECFHEKDYLNHRYHAKRFLYLCKIKKHLDGLPQFDSLRWSAFQNEARKPILVVSPGFHSMLWLLFNLMGFTSLFVNNFAIVISHWSM